MPGLLVHGFLQFHQSGSLRGVPLIPVMLFADYIFTVQGSLGDYGGLRFQVLAQGASASGPRGPRRHKLCHIVAPKAYRPLERGMPLGTSLKGPKPRSRPEAARKRLGLKAAILFGGRTCRKLASSRLV